MQAILRGNPKQQLDFVRAHGVIKPVQISYTNKSDTIQTVSVFETFNKNSDNIEVIVESGKTSMEFVKKYFYNTPHLTSSLTVNFDKQNYTQLEKVFYEIETNPMGEVIRNTGFVLLDAIKTTQFQNKFIEVEYGFVVDGLTKDLEFELLPNSSISILINFQNKCNRNIECLKKLNEECDTYNSTRKDMIEYLDSVFVENTTNETKIVDLLNSDLLQVYNSKDSGLLVGDIFNRIGDGRISRYKTDILANYYSEHTKKHLYFNAMRVAVTKGNRDISQISKPIQFNSGNTYCPYAEFGNSFQPIVDINTVGEELSTFNPFRVSILPNTRVVFLFKKINVDITLFKLNKDESFVNILAENNSDSKKEVNIIVNPNDKDLNYIMVKNKVALGYDSDKEFTGMKVMFNNQEQMNRPILLKGMNIDNKLTTYAIHPVSFLDACSFNSNIVTIPFPSLSFDNKMNGFSMSDQLIFDLSNNGDGVNVVLFKEKISQPLDGVNSFVIEIENVTDAEKEIDLVNDIKNFKELPEGVKIKVGKDKDYKFLLEKIEKSKPENKQKAISKHAEAEDEIDVAKYTKDVAYKMAVLNTKILNQEEYCKLSVHKMYSENSEQVSELWIYNTDKSLEEIKKSDSYGQHSITTWGYFNKNSNVIDFGKERILYLDLNAKETEGSSVRNLKTVIMPKTKLFLVCTLSSISKRDTFNGMSRSYCMVG